ncbi:hypothetical protein EAL2_808p05790 (plasmid) [Peptoclostridium acidaminophilum DSM 3953]|uniref:Uncharacterized protein n=1 Tax=Peptoclostridium acidaminophilum DSM 3953 TaxID=1286171 RepID=W8TPN9_PEPAC|nr:hypothetical protein [Peptoclostridium acidaminophilum]AHM58082.1 hypothetical protein EAL2_808p05790 [Peptoclostridium acidaminophilum DSM 3953]
MDRESEEMTLLEILQERKEELEHMIATGRSETMKRLQEQELAEILNQIDRIAGSKSMHSIDKEYLDSHKYIEKIRLFLEKEYGGSAQDPIVQNESYSNNTHEKSECYRSFLFICVQGEQQDDVKSFYVSYDYSIHTDTGTVYESFETYRHSETVYLQSPDGEKHIKVF